MLRRTPACHVRRAKIHRPKERAWEFFNHRDFALRTDQNFRSLIGAFTIISSVMLYECYRTFQRIKARGDSCPSCEAVRRKYRQNLATTERMYDGIPAGQLPRSGGATRISD